MRHWLRTICVSAVVLGASLAWAQQAPRMDGQVTIERQLRLKRQLLLGSQESLVATLRSNMLEWQKLTPEQRQQLRRQAYAFLRDATPQQQKEIVDAWANFYQMTGQQKDLYRERARWIKAVLDSLPPQRKTELSKMAPADQAKELLRLKAQMQAEGKLAPDMPTTATSAPASPPAPPARPTQAR